MRLRPPYAEPGEEETPYEIVEDNGDSVTTRPVVWPWRIVPNEAVGADMIEEERCAHTS